MTSSGGYPVDPSDREYVGATLKKLREDVDEFHRRLISDSSAPAGGFQVGAISAWAASVLPPDHFELNGQTIVGGASTYTALAALFPGWVSGANLILPDWRGRVPVGQTTKSSVGTATMTIASPTVITRSAHGLANGQRVSFTTTGALPTGITAGTRYFVRDVTANTFRLALTRGGTLINATGSQSGTHTLWRDDFTVLGSQEGELAHTHQHTSPTGMNSGTPLGVSLADDTYLDTHGSYDYIGIFTANQQSSSVAMGVGGLEKFIVTSTKEEATPPSVVVRWIVCAVSSIGEGDPTVQAALVDSVNGLLQRVGGSVKRSATSRTFVANSWYVLDTAADWAVDLAAEGGMAAFNGTWVVPETGIYAIDATVSFGASINLLLAVKVNSAAANLAGGILIDSGVGTAFFTGVSVSGERPLTAGDVLRVAVFPNGYAGSASWNTNGSVDAPIAGYFGIRKVSDV